jgi:hypothetical protein
MPFMGNQVESNEIKILTVNHQVLGDYSKRSDVLNYFKTKKHNIYFLQDTHFTYSEENSIESQCNNDIESIEHLFIECPLVKKKIWIDIEEWLLNKF